MLIVTLFHVSHLANDTVLKMSFFWSTEETIHGVLVMNQPDLFYVPYIRKKYKGYRIVVAIEKGYDTVFLHLTAYPKNECDVEKLAFFPLLSEVAVDVTHIPGRTLLSDINKTDLTSCSKCCYFTPVTYHPVTPCVGCDKIPLKERISGVWILKYIKEYTLPQGLTGKKLTFEQPLKIMIYKTWLETPFFEVLSTLKIGQSVRLDGWIEVNTLKPPRYFTNVVPI